MPCNKECEEHTLRTLLQLRQEIQQAIDDALLEGQISVDSAASLAQATTSHFAIATRRTLNAAGAFPLSRKRKVTTDITRDSEPHQRSSYQQSKHTTSVTQRRVSSPSPRSLSTDQVLVSSNKDGGSQFVGHAPKRRKRMPRLRGEYPCRHCKKPFDRAGDRTKHEAIHEPEKRVSHCCPDCGKNFSYPKDLRRHMDRLHHKLRHVEASPSPACSPTDTLAGSGSESPFSLGSDLTGDVLTTDDTFDLIVASSAPLESLISPGAKAPKNHYYNSSQDALGIQESLGLLCGSLRLSILAAEHHGVSPEETPNLSAAFATLKTFIPLVEPDSNDFPDCLRRRQSFDAGLTQPTEVISELLYLVHMLLTLLHFQNDSFQSAIQQIIAPQTGGMFDIMLRANAHLKRAKVKAHASQFGFIMNQLVAGLKEIALTRESGSGITE